jgi:hypothetical protein
MSDIFGIGAIASSVTGALEQSAQQQAAMNQAQEAIQQYNNLGVPPDLAAPIILQQMKSAGTLTPQLEQTLTQSPSALAGYQNNQTYQNAQQSALNSMLQRGQGGLTASDRAAYNQVQSQNAQAVQGQQGAIQQQYQSMGQGGGGTQLAAELANQQGQDQNLYNSGLQIAGQANQNALQAMSQAGQLGGQLQAQNFGVAQAKAQSQNAINQFNTQNALGVQAANTQAQNAAQAANLQNAQNISNYNTLQANQESQREVQAEQQDYANQYALAGSKANADLNLGGLGMQQAANTGQAFTNISGGLGQMGQSFGSSNVFGGGNNSATPSTSTSGTSSDSTSDLGEDDGENEYSNNDLGGNDSSSGNYFSSVA